MAETLVLDPAAVATGRTELDITKLVGGDGPDFEDSSIEAFMADGTYGQVPVDYRRPNRTVTIPLALRDADGMTFEEARAAVQAKAALLQREGGWLSRSTAVGTLYADVVNATIKLGASNQAAWGHVDVDATLTLECLPDWYEDEIALDSMTATSPLGLAQVLRQGGTPATIRGDIPARCRVRLTNNSAAAQRGVLAAFRYQDAATTAKMVYPAGDLTPLDAAYRATTAIYHGGIGTEWTPVMSTNLLSGAALTHTGPYRVFAGIETAFGMTVRLVWGAGDLANPQVNPPKRLRTPDEVNQVQIVDLGEVSLPRQPVGSPRWEGNIQAHATTAGTGIRIERLWLVPVSDSAALLAAPPSPSAAFGTYIGRDTFSQAAGPLGGKTADQGGTWTTAGNTTDIAVETTGKTAQRATVAESSTGRTAVIGASNVPTVVVQVDVRSTSWGTNLNGGPEAGVLARYADASNYVGAYIGQNGSLNIIRRTAGTGLVIANKGVAAQPNTWYTIRLLVAGQTAVVWFGPQGTEPVLTLIGQAADMVSTGKPGIRDANPSNVVSTRSFDNFIAYHAIDDAIVYPGRQAELRTDGNFRQNPDGTAWRPTKPPQGDLLRVPPSGMEDRPVELLLKPSQGDFDQVADFGLTDSIGVEVLYRPCWLTVPGA